MPSFLVAVRTSEDAADDRRIEVALHGTSLLVPGEGEILACFVVSVALVLDTAVVSFGVEPGEVTASR